MAARASLVMLGLALASQGVRQLAAIDSQVARMSALSDNTSILRIAALLQSARSTALQYKTSASLSGLHDGDAADAQIAALLQAAAQSTVSDDRRRTYREMEDSVTAFHELRGELTRLSQEVLKSRAALFSGGDQMSAATVALVAAAQRSNELPIRTAARDVQTAILLVRVTNWRFLATTDANGPATFRTNAESAMTALAAIEKQALSAAASFGP